jgi:transposase InsO family protein
MFELLSQQQEERPAAERAISALGEAAGLSRSTVYRYRRNGNRSMSESDTALRDAVQRVALEWPSYGYRRITAELHRRGVVANHKRVLRLMHEDNLLCFRRRSFIATTDSRHSHRVYENLAARMSLTNINQLWVADITYIRLRGEFVYLAVLLDAFSRRVIGWSLAERLSADLALNALQMALHSRHLGRGLVHHSDRGVQYACDAYTALLEKNKIRISMSRTGNPYDNSKAERFIRTLKYEEVYLNDYDDLADARSSIGRFLDDVYNHKRLHSAIGYVPPAEFERSFRQPLYA